MIVFFVNLYYDNNYLRKLKRKDIMIELKKWKVCAFDAYVPFNNKSMELNREIQGITPWMDIEVPGGLYSTLLKEGLIEDPMFEMNSLKCEWVSARWWVYKTSFTCPSDIEGRTELVLEGIDYRATVYVNEHEVNKHTGMFTKCVTEISRYLRAGEENTVSVVIEDAPKEIPQVGYTSMTSTQKARNNYKWDFCVRMINLGLYGKVYVKFYKSDLKIENYYFNSDCGADGVAELSVRLSSKEERSCIVRAALIGQDGEVLASAEKSAGLKNGSRTIKLRINTARLKVWYPNGSGSQSLYELSVNVTDREGTELDGFNAHVGIKKLRLLENPGSPEGSLPYTFEVNGERVYIKGVNITPLDMEYGCVDACRYRRFLTAVKEMNVNLVRVWGGGIIETEEFYSLCDELGILVWQDFIQSSSGIDNFPSENPEFLRLLAATAEEATLTKRNHVSLAVWCGGNELMYAGFKPVGFEVKAIALLKRIVKKNCRNIFMYPTTPSGPVFSFGKREDNHDVHGPWTYLGTEEHYRVFNENEYLFHSEFGVDGLTSPAVARRIMSDENLGYIDMDENIVWRHRGEWWNVYKREKQIFGENIDGFDTFSLASQFMQAEGLRYAIESGRRQNFRCSGNIIWQANEPFPNISCTSLIDYFGGKKLAYYAAKTAYQRILPCIKYTKLTHERGALLDFQAYAVSEDEAQPLIYSVKIYSENTKIAEDKFEFVFGSGSIWLKDYSIHIPADAESITVVLSITDADGNKYHNGVLFPMLDGKGMVNPECLRTFCERLRSGEPVYPVKIAAAESAQPMKQRETAQSSLTDSRLNIV